MISGSINYIGNTFNDLPNRDLGKYRYIRIDQYPYIIELFVGKDAGDFKPRYENIDQLKVGDAIKVYGYETSATAKEGVNRTIQFIEKDNVLFYEHGSASKMVGFSIMIIAILLTVFGFIMWKKGKIKY